MRINGLKAAGTKPERVKTKSGNYVETGNNIQQYRSPDGTKGSYRFFLREAERGRLHGCLISSSN